MLFVTKALLVSHIFVKRFRVSLEVCATFYTDFLFINNSLSINTEKTYPFVKPETS